MSGNNEPNSQYDVLTTATHFQAEFERCIRAELEGQSVVFDDLLSYQTALKRLRNNDNFNESDTDNLPLFAYKRTVMKDVEDGLGRRARSKTACIEVNGKVLQYDMAYGQFEMLFAYYTKDIELLEKFEVTYNNDSGISKDKEVVVGIGDLGEFPYFLTWNDLEEFTVEEDDDNHFKAIAGSVNVRGFFFSFKGEGQLIKELNALIHGVDKLPNPEALELLGNINVIG